MLNAKTGRLLICLGLTLATGFAAVSTADAGLFGLFKAKKKPAPVVRKSLVVFPFDSTSATAVSEGFGEEIASYLKSVLSGSDGYMAVLYQERLAPIRRAKEDTTLKSQDTTGPFAEDKEKCLKLARLLATDVYLVGSIEDYQFDVTKKVAQITLAAEMYDGKSGKLLGQYLVTGSADESSKASLEEEYRAVAAGKAVDALKERIMPGSAPEPAPEPADEAEPQPEEPAEEPASEPAK